MMPLDFGKPFSHDNETVSPSLVDKIRAKRDAEQAAYGKPESTNPARPLMQWKGVGRFLDAEPEPVDFVLANCLPVGVVGAIFAGGGIGKTTLAIQLSIAIATGKQFGPFLPTRRRKVLLLAGEDPENILHIRTKSAADALGITDSDSLSASLRENFDARSLLGEERVIIALDDQANPARTDTYQWMHDSISGMGGVEVLIIDPLSRYYGLNENDNAHATAWVACLEKLVKDLGITVLFLHHEPKAQAQGKAVSGGRGASAFRDGIRWALSLSEMDEKTASTCGVERSRHIVAEFTKSNYTARWPGPVYFCRSGSGMLEQVNPVGDLAREQAEALALELADAGVELTRSELSKQCSKDQDRQNAIKEICDALTDKWPDMKVRKDIDRIINTAIRFDMIREQERVIGKTSKLILCVCTGRQTVHDEAK